MGTPRAGSVLFEPDPAATTVKGLIGRLRPKLVLGWIAQDSKKAAKPQGKDKPRPDELTHRLNAAVQREEALRRLAANAHSAEGDESIRERVIKIGLRDRSGVHVLPLGRVECEKPRECREGGEDPKTWVLAVVVATAELPLGSTKGFSVKGEFRDRSGRSFSFTGESLPASPKNGVFVVSILAGKALDGAEEFEGFIFKLLEVKPLK